MNKMKTSSSKQGQTVEATSANGTAISADTLIKQPWQFWKQKELCQSLFKSYLLKSFKGLIELRRRSAYIKEEINKKRSRKAAAIKRAIAASRKDAIKLQESAITLNPEDLWTYVEKEIAYDIDTLNARLDNLLEKQPRTILKHKERTAKLQEAHGSNLRTRTTTGEGPTALTQKDKQLHGDGDDDDDDGADNDGDMESSGDEGDQNDDDHEQQNIDVDNGASEHDEDNSTTGTDEHTKPKKATKSINDRFFNMEEMEEFADRDFDDQTEQFNYFESMGEESDGSKPAVDMMYEDFFDDPNNEESEGENDDQQNGLHCSRELEGLDEEEREMELLLQKVEQYEDSEDDQNDRDDVELMDMQQIGHMEEREWAKEQPDGYNDDNPDDSNVYENNTDDADTNDRINDEISRVEKTLISQKHWSLMGEATARKRPRNSLLDLDIELPQNSAFIHVEKDDKNVAKEQDYGGDDDDNAIGQDDTQDMPIEIIIQQRIKAEVFDNVERKIPIEDQLEAIERLKQKRNKIDAQTVEIDFNKSKMGLGDVYAKRYQEMFMATDQMDEHKTKLTEDFAKLMYKLDALCNYNIVPKKLSEAEKGKQVPSILVEAPINVVTASRHSDLVDENMEGNKITRNAKKRKFTNKLKGLLKSGKATLEDINRIKQKAMQRNKQKIQDARAIKATGQTNYQGKQEKKYSNRRVNIAQLMAKQQSNTRQ